MYATLYPDRVRRMVLDSNVDPRRVWYDANLDQDFAFQKTFEVYFGWLAKYDSVYHLGSTARAVKRVYNTQLRALAVNPADGVFGPDELTDVFTGPAYYVYGWTDVAEAFAAWVNHGDISGMRALWESSYPTGEGADNGYAMYLATECTDAHWPQSWQQWRRDNWRIFDEAPFLTWANAWFNAPCRDWSGHAGRPVDIDGRQVHDPILLIDETLDPATPFEGSLEVRSRFPRSSLIEGVGGTTHAGSLSGVACVDDAIATYLTDGTVPPRKPGRRSDLKCDPVPQPVPAAAAARQRAPRAAAGMPAVLRDALMRAQLH